MCLEYRRRLGATGESYQPPASPTSVEDIEAAGMSLAYMGLLDPVLPQESSLWMKDLDDNDLKLQRLLSIKTVVPTTSSAAEEQAKAQTQTQTTQTFKPIGAGGCGLIVAYEGKALVAKLGKSTDSHIWNDFKTHLHIYEVIQKHHLDLKVARCYYYVPKDESLYFEKHEGLLAAAASHCSIPTNLLVSERIVPLPKETRSLLIEKYCPEQAKETALRSPANRDCLVRVYLGSMRSQSSKFFSLRNFKLHLHQMIELKLDVEEMASELGKTMAILHWEVKIDARDVEFVLGSSTAKVPTSSVTYQTAMANEGKYNGPASRVDDDFFHRETTLWLLDFNEVQEITMDESGVAQALNAMETNDPYFPKPLQSDPVAKSVWNSFVKSYMEKSREVLKHEDRCVQRLPQVLISGFIDAIRRKQRAAAATL